MTSVENLLRILFSFEAVVNKKSESGSIISDKIQRKSLKLSLLQERSLNIECISLKKNLLGTMQ